jgi:signal transduction histidine kinase
VQAFSDFLKNIKDRIDVVPFEDSNSKVDFYFAKLIDSLQAKIIEADVIKSCYVIKDLIANATRFEQISRATGKAPVSHRNPTEIPRKNRIQRGRGRGMPNH